MTRATFITVERPLDPQPSGGKELSPWWCYANTLTFHNKSGKTVWSQKIPEAALMYYVDERGCTEFGRPVRCEVFFEKEFGWQLRYTFSHETAKRLLKTLWTSLRRQHPKLRKEVLEVERKVKGDEI